MLTLGMVSYCNALPLSYAFQNDETLSLWQATPNQLFHALEEKQLSCALTSSLHVLDNSLQPFSSFCIAAEKEVLSVTLYYKGALSQLKRIAIHDETTTSFALLRILCHYHWKLSPHFEVVSSHDKFPEYDGCLLIGDLALTHPMAGYRSIDLATAWYEMTASPFVFALFFAKKEHSLPLQKIEEKLAASYRLGIEKREEIIHKVHREKKVPLARVQKYYNFLRYTMGGRESAALAQFLSLYRSLPHELYERTT